MLMLSILLLVNPVAASRAVPTQDILAHCDDIADGEILLKYKTEKHKKEAFKYHQAKAKNHLKSKLRNFDINEFKPALDLEHLLQKGKRELIPNAKMKERQKEILAWSLHEGLDDMYLIHLEPKPNMLFDWIDSMQGKVKESRCNKILAMLTELQTDPDVDFAEPNYKYNLDNFAADTASAQSQSLWGFDYQALWGIEEIQANQVWNESQGQGVVVAVIDSGVNYNHPDLWNNIWVNPSVVADRNRDGRRNLSDLDSNSNRKIEVHELLPDAIGHDFADGDTAPMDDAIGHGTHVAGIIAAESSNGIGVVGVAPRAQIMPLRIFNSRGQTSTTILIKALLYAAKKGADLANLSLTGSSYSQALARTIKVVSKKMIVVAAAGNEGRDISGVNTSTIASPAGIDGVISVASMTNTRTRSRFSNHGFNVDFAAPGSSRFGSANILSTDITSSGYNLRAGTSMAAPYVTGAVALLLSKNPNLKYDEVVNRLGQNALSINDDRYLGAGVPQLAESFDSSNRLPRVTLKVPEYQYPKLKTLSDAVSIKGSVLGDDLVSYKIEIAPGTNPSEWETLSNQQQRFMKKGILLRGFETRSHKNGLYTLRLSAVNSLGERVYDQKLVNIKN